MFHIGLNIAGIKLAHTFLVNKCFQKCYRNLILTYCFRKKKNIWRGASLSHSSTDLDHALKTNLYFILRLDATSYTLQRTQAFTCAFLHVCIFPQTENSVHVSTPPHKKYEVTSHPCLNGIKLANKTKFQNLFHKNTYLMSFKWTWYENTKTIPIHDPHHQKHIGMWF